MPNSVLVLVEISACAAAFHSILLWSINTGHNCWSLGLLKHGAGEQFMPVMWLVAWNSIERLQTALNLMKLKFKKHPQLQLHLQETAGQTLLHNTSDDYWGLGVDSNPGASLLMELRHQPSPHNILILADSHGRALQHKFPSNFEVKTFPGATVHTMYRYTTTHNLICDFHKIVIHVGSSDMLTKEGRIKRLPTPYHNQDTSAARSHG